MSNLKNALNTVKSFVMGLMNRSMASITSVLQRAVVISIMLYLIENEYLHPDALQHLISYIA